MISSVSNEMIISAVQLPVLELTSMGASIKEISVRLGIPQSTVTQRQKLMKKNNNCLNLTHLVAEALRYGVIK